MEAQCWAGERAKKKDTQELLAKTALLNLLGARGESRELQVPHDNNLAPGRHSVERRGRDPPDALLRTDGGRNVGIQRRHVQT